MDIENLASLSKWLEGTDLEEITLRFGKDRITLKTCNEEIQPQIACTQLKSIQAPCIGIFRFAKPGTTSSIRQGASVSEGDILGWMETGREKTAIHADCPGKIKIITVQDGQAAEYGQPLFFIEPEN